MAARYLNGCASNHRPALLNRDIGAGSLKEVTKCTKHDHLNFKNPLFVDNLAQ